MNGFKQLPNEFYKLLQKLNLSGSEFRVLLFIVEKTYGWGKTEDLISNSQIEEALDMPIRTVIAATQTLQLLQIIALVEKGKSKNQPNRWEFDMQAVINRGPVQKTAVVKKTTAENCTSAENCMELVQKTANTKETITKENIYTSNELVQKTAVEEQPPQTNGVEESTETTLDEKFSEFWKAYPVKKGKEDCRKKYSKLEKIHEQIMAGLNNYLADAERKRKRGEWVPEFKNPKTWLIGKHWEDEYENHAIKKAVSKPAEQVVAESVDTEPDKEATPLEKAARVYKNAMNRFQATLSKRRGTWVSLQDDNETRKMFIEDFQKEHPEEYNIIATNEDFVL